MGKGFRYSSGMSPEAPTEPARSQSHPHPSPYPQVQPLVTIVRVTSARCVHQDGPLSPRWLLFVVITLVLGDEVKGAYKPVRGTDPSDWEFLKLRAMLTSDWKL